MNPVPVVLKYKRIGTLGAISLLKDIKTDMLTWRWRNHAKVLDFSHKDFDSFKEFENWVINNHG